MTNDIPNPPMPNPPPPMPDRPMMSSSSVEPFFQTWIRAVTRPGAATYKEMAAAPNASAATGFIWVFLTALLEFFISILVGQIGEAQLRYMQRFGGGGEFPVPGAGSPLFRLVCGAPIAAVLTLLGFMLFVGVVHLIAQAFGGKGTYGQLAYVFAAIYAPVALVSTLIALLEAIPLLGVAVAFCFIPLSILLLIYVVVLEVIATGAVYQIGGGGATVSVLALPVVLIVCLGCAVIAGLMALGPTIGNIFSSINSSLQSTP